MPEEVHISMLNGACLSYSHSPGAAMATLGHISLEHEGIEWEVMTGDAL